MASMELRANVFDKLNYLLDNDEAMEGLNARIDEAEAEEEAGLAGVPHEQVMQRMRKMIAAL